jgi:riboflavin kinase / FMN adenylyltransferase
MRIFRNFEEARIIRNPVVTTGSFDGVHLGHKTILNRLKMLAEKNDGESVLITFHPHPRLVLNPDTAGKGLRLINSQEEKLELLRKAGLNNIIIIEFTRDFAKTTSQEFIKRFLVDILHARVVVAGFNHHFGFNKTGDFNQLLEMGSKYNFIAEEIPEQEVQHETVSSTLIRQAIQDGYIQRANAYLDHYYIITGTAELFDSDSLPDSVQFYRIMITEGTKLLPAEGIYAVSFGDDYNSTRGMAVIFKDKTTDTKVLLHPFNLERIFTGIKVTLYFQKRVYPALSAANLNVTSGIIRSAIKEIEDLIY